MSELSSLEDPARVVERLAEHQLLEHICDLMATQSSSFYAFHRAKKLALYYDYTSAVDVWESSAELSDRKITIHSTFLGGLLALITKGEGLLHHYLSDTLDPPRPSTVTKLPSYTISGHPVRSKSPAKAATLTHRPAVPKESTTAAFKAPTTTKGSPTKKDAEMTAYEAEIWKGFECEISDSDIAGIPQLQSRSQPRFPSVDISTFPPPMLSPRSTPWPIPQPILSRELKPSPTVSHNRQNTGGY
ncbi:hypothetical protein PM082_008653 [Marasmius tenuissimus]|nr:hypothetical protein PM082_008653 [Marasmius tenuissimus]